jgi:protein TonB
MPSVAHRSPIAAARDEAQAEPLDRGSEGFAVTLRRSWRPMLALGIALALHLGSIGIYGVYFHEEQGIELVSGGKPVSGESIETNLVTLPPPPEPEPPEPVTPEPPPVVEEQPPEPEPLPPEPVAPPVPVLALPEVPASVPEVPAPPPLPQKAEPKPKPKPPVQKPRKPVLKPKPAQQAAAAAVSPTLLQGADTASNSAALKCAIPQPAYPSKARRLQHEGRVVLRVTVSAGGSIDQAVVIKSSGFDELDRAAVEGARRGRCQGGKAGMTRSQPINFKLE